MDVVTDKNPHNLVKDLSDDIEGIIQILNDTYEILRSPVMKIRYTKNRLQNLGYKDPSENETKFLFDHSTQEKAYSFLNNLNFSF